MARPASHRLFGEIHDFIIDHLYDHKAALLACALTCKAWLPTVRYHWYHTMILGPPHKRLASTRFFEQIMPTIPGGIGHLVKDLTIRETAGNRWICIDSTANIPAMDNLRHLQLYATRYEPGTPAGLWIEKFLEGIQSLKLENLLVLNMDVAVSFMSLAAPSLKSLSLGTNESVQFIRLGFSPAPLSPKHVAFPALTFLDIRCRGPFFYRISGDILATSPPPAIRSMTLPIRLTTWYEEDVHEMDVISSVINALASTLEELYFISNEWRVHGSTSFSCEQVFRTTISLGTYYL